MTRSATPRALVAIAATGALLLTGVIPAHAATSTGLSITETRLNETISPLGIADERPAFTWKLASAGKGMSQSAYEIIVSSDESKLAAGDGDVWSSGRVESSQSVQVDYAGPQLESATRYHWKVRVWDQNGVVSDWSEPQWWEMGLLDPADWGDAQWIAPQAERVEYTDTIIEADFRIWRMAGGLVFRATDPGNMNMWQVNLEQEVPRLRQHIWRGGGVVANREVPIPAEAIPVGEGEGVTHRLRVQAEGSTYTSWIDDVLVDEWTVDEAQLNPSGVIGFRGGDPLPGSPDNHTSAWGNVVVTDLDGAALWNDDFDGTSSSAYFPGAIVEGGWLMRRKNEVALASAPTPNSPLLRTEFALDRPVASARVYAYGLGFYELSVNGEKADDRVLAPSATPYADRGLYQTYDVTDFVQEGENAVGLWLAEGYGASYSEWGWQWRGPRQAIASIQVEYADGTSEVIGTSPDTWKSASSPISSATLYNGETYDARQEIDGWAEPGLDDSNWSATQAVAAPSDRLEADEMPAVRVTQTIEPISVTEPSPGVFIYDLGQNIAGWTQLRDLDVPAGTTVTVRHAEMLGEDGRLDTHTNRNAQATERYTSAGTGPVSWEPRFTYHGFRFIEVTGVNAAPNVVGRVVHADLEDAATFESSEPLLDRIFLNNRWTIVNNFMSFPTDTPVRDERTPPQMDVQAHQDASMKTLNMSSYFRKYLEDLPGARQGRTYAGDTTMFGIQIPLALALYEEYGDRQVLEEQWSNVRNRAEWLLTNHPTGVWPYTEGAHGDQGRFGDWCPPLPEPEANGGLGGWNVGACFSEPNLVTSALQYRHITQVSEMAAILGHDEDAARYARAAEVIADAVNAEYLNEDGSYASGRQTTSILPIAFGMVPEDRFDQVAAYFIDRVENVDRGHVDTGIFGTRFLIDALTAVGRVDLAYGTMTKTTYPSFGYQILEHDATTAWEGWTLRSGMQTYDHAMFIGPNSSFLTEFAGIRSVQAGYEQIRIAPQVPPALERVAATQETVRGEVGSAWTQTSEAFTLDVTIPVNATAEIVVPVAEGRQVVTPEGAELVDKGETAWTFTVGSGAHRFVATAETADVVAPVVSLTPQGVETDGWFASLAVEVDAEDEAGGSGIAAIEFAIGDGAWQAYDGPIEVGAGTTTVKARATDNGGNTSETASATYKVDPVAPSLWASVNDSGALTSIAVDPLSGIDRVEYRAAEAWSPSPVGAGLGSGVRAFDLVGNETMVDAAAASSAAFSVAVNDKIVVARNGFEPGADVRVEVHSAPVLLGTVKADADGVVQLTALLPDTISGGAHTLVFLVDDKVVDEIPLDVSSGRGPDGALATTGGGDWTLIAVGAFLLLALGGGLIVSRRRRA